jgi:hypothetical protein
VGAGMERLGPNFTDLVSCVVRPLKSLRHICLHATAPLGFSTTSDILVFWISEFPGVVFSSVVQGKTCTW